MNAMSIVARGRRIGAVLIPSIVMIHRLERRSLRERSIEWRYDRIRSRNEDITTRRRRRKILHRRLIMVSIGSEKILLELRRWGRKGARCEI